MKQSCGAAMELFSVCLLCWAVIYFPTAAPLGTAGLDPNDQSEIMRANRKRNPEQQEISNIVGRTKRKTIC